MNKKQRADDGVDQILQLPDHLVERIISFLPLKYAVRTSILSKRWENLWITASSKLEFDTDFFGLKFHPIRYVDEIKAKKRVDLLNFVERTLHLCHSHSHSHSQIASISKLVLHLPVYSSEVATTLDRCIWYAIGCNAKELVLNIIFLEYGFYNLSHSVFTAKSLTKLSLHECKLEFSSCTINMNFSSLKELSLLGVDVNDQILQNLIANCPVIEKFRLGSCHRSNRILKISGLVNPKLVNVEILNGKFERVEIEVPGLQRFCIGRVFKVMPIELNVSTCKNMRKLYLGGTTVTDEWLHYVISKLCLLEKLYLYHCDVLESIKISSRRLKDLEVRMCRKLFNVEIDVPNLSVFKYHGNGVIFFSSNSLALSRADICLYMTTVNTHWYAILTEFLGKFNNSKVLTLIGESAKGLIVPKEFRYSLMPPLYNVESLMLELRQELLGQSVEDTVDGLLWLSPHPVSLSITLKKTRTLEFKFFYKELDGERYPYCCCSPLPITCWRHCLMEVQVVSHGWLEEEEVRKIKSFLEHKSELLMEVDGFTNKH